MLLHSCCCIFNYVMFGFCSTQKKSSKSLGNEFTKLFHKRKRKSFIFSLSSLVLACWPNQPTSPSLPQAEEGTAPSSPSAQPSGPLALFLGRPAGQRALPPPSTDRRSPPSPAADMWACHPPSPTSCHEGRRPSFFLPPPRFKQSARSFPS
jgi:hypothetical protein